MTNTTAPPMTPTLVLGTSTTPPFHHMSLQETQVAAHTLITGITGMGKSSAIAGWAVQRMNQGIATAVIDVHGDLVDTILELLIDTGYFSDERAYKKLLYVDFSKTDAHIPFNFLKQPFEYHAIADNTLEAFKRCWPELADGSAVNLENILLSSICVLCENNLPLTKLQRLLIDQEYRDDLLQNVSDEEIVEFFQRRFAGYGRQAGAYAESTLRRVFLLTFSPILRGCLGQVENTLDFRALMDNQISCLFNLSNLDPQTQKLLGCLLTVGFETAALSRSNIPQFKRSPYALFIDEFAQFSRQSAEAMEDLLTQARKFGVTLCLSTQTMSQAKALHGALQNAIHVSFRMGYEDAATLAPKFADPNYERMLQAGVTTLLAPKERGERYSDAEVRSGWLKLLKGLPQREALVSIGHQTTRIRTLSVHTKPETLDKLKEVKDRYSKLLLTPQSTSQSTPQSKPIVLKQKSGAAPSVSGRKAKTGTDPGQVIDMTPKLAQKQAGANKGSRRFADMPIDEEHR